MFRIRNHPVIFIPFQFNIHSELDNIHWTDHLSLLQITYHAHSTFLLGSGPQYLSDAQLVYYSSSCVNRRNISKQNEFRLGESQEGSPGGEC